MKLLELLKRNRRDCLLFTHTPGHDYGYGSTVSYYVDNRTTTFNRKYAKRMTHRKAESIQNMTTDKTWYIEQEM